MSNITIDGKVYDQDLFSEETRNNIRMLKHADQEIQRLETQLAIARAARIHYGQVVKEGIEAYPIYPDHPAIQ